jgi:RHS repeat-associated protein
LDWLGTPTNQFSGTAPVPTGTSQVAVQATDASGNVRTNTYEITQAGSSKSFTYDANGNTTSEGTKTYEWNAENRLTRVCTGACQPGTDPPNMLARFTYDGNGRRASKTAGGITTTYVYDGAQFLEERPSAGPTKRYVYGRGIDRPLAQIVGGTTTYNVADHLGSIVRTTDSLGTPTLTRQYDPWGNPIQGSTASGYAFTGREWDAEVGIYHLRARYYDARPGRFIGADPIGFQGGVNIYAYAANNPLNAIDPFGTRSIAFTGCEVWFMDDECNIEKQCQAGSGAHGSKVADQAKSWYGPTPEGEYTIEPREFSGGWWSIFRASGWGKWRAPLHPSGGTNTYGRENFFLHGDTRGDYSSAGCIDIGTCDTWARDWAMKKPDSSITVYVQYMGNVCN